MAKLEGGLGAGVKGHHPRFSFDPVPAVRRGNVVDEHGVSALMMAAFMGSADSCEVWAAKLYCRGLDSSQVSGPMSLVEL